MKKSAPIIKYLFCSQKVSGLFRKQVLGGHMEGEYPLRSKIV